jgi:DNA-binding LytR/AlgR family response regulator
MNAPTAILADDEPHLSAFLKGRLAALWPELKVLALPGNGLEALSALAEHEPDIAFLDIKMPGLSGLQVAERVKGGVHIVFVTAYDDFAVEAFDREATDYLLKPITDERLQRAIDRLKGRLARNETPAALDDVLARLVHLLPRTGAAPRALRWIRASKGEVTYQVPVDEITHFTAEDKYTVVHSKEGEYLIRTALSDLTEELDGEVFWQVHRSTIVNMNFVQSTRRDLASRLFLTLRGVKGELPVSRAYVHLFRQH